MVVKKAKKTRTYDAKARIERARQGRERLIEVARRAFLNQGYAATTVAEIANEAGVSVETIYKTFGGKTGLVRAIYERGLAGRELIPAPARSDAISASEANPSALVRKWGALTAEVAPLVAPILLLIRAAAVSNPELLPLLAEADAQRLKRMADNAAVSQSEAFSRPE